MNQARSLLLITVDCLRFDHVGFNGYRRSTTPFLDGLAAESVVLRNAIVAGSPTYYSFPAIMASRYPLALGRDLVGLVPGEPTLASHLNEMGYATAAFIAANPYLSRRFGYEAGFETFDDFLDPDEALPAEEVKNGAGGRLNRKLAALAHRSGSLGKLYDELYFHYGQHVAKSEHKSFDELRRFPAADVLVKRAEAWLRSTSGRPFFLWIHFMDPHAPYYPVERSLQMMGEKKLDSLRARYLNSYWNRGGVSVSRLRGHRDQIIALYDAGIRWVDEQIGQLVGVLCGLNLWDSCVAALTADHGEEFLEHGGKFHSPSRLTPELIRVPMLLRVPGGRGAAHNSPFSLLDLAPTLLDAMGGGAPPEFRGRNRWPRLRSGETWDEPVISESVGSCSNPYRAADRVGARMLVVRDRRYQLVFDFGGAGEAELFDLEGDPYQVHALPSSAEIAARRRLLEAAHKHIGQSLRLRGVEDGLQGRLREFRLEWGH
jgi:arylsulfatase A-like enzyme